MQVNPMAGKPATTAMLVNVAKLVATYYSDVPDPSLPEQLVAFGTSGHRGSSLATTFNEWHVLTISQAICDYRSQHKIDGPLFLGIDTHALSEPAFTSALEVLAANGVNVMISANNEYTPTPAVSLAIIAYNRTRDTGLADGIIITPSHNPPEDGGFKYNPTHGGPADSDVTRWIETQANAYLKNELKGIKRMSFQRALTASTTHRHDYLTAYVVELGNVLDMDVIRTAGIRMGADPLGGAGVHYWRRIGEHYRLDITVASEEVDQTFRFMSLDWDGRIRMDPSSPYAMQRLIQLRNQFDISFACDTDHDRHGIVTPSVGLMPPNHYLAAAINYLFQYRPDWPIQAAVGKTVVSSGMIDRVAAKHGRKLYEVPVGFKWFVSGLADASLGFGGEESAGAAFLRKNGAVWTTEKDGILLALLAAEITARTGRDPGENYRALEQELGVFTSNRVDAAATVAQKSMLSKLTPQQIKSDQLAGEKIVGKLSNAPGNSAPIGGVKISTASGWFAARPSGTENIYKIYAESTRGTEHLQRILNEAQVIVDTALAAANT